MKKSYIKVYIDRNSETIPSMHTVDVYYKSDQVCEFEEKVCIAIRKSPNDKLLHCNKILQELKDGSEIEVTVALLEQLHMNNVKEQVDYRQGSKNSQAKITFIVSLLFILCDYLY